MERATLYEQLGQWANAADDYSLMLLKQPFCVEARHGRAQARKRLNQWESAAADFQHLLQAVPQRATSDHLELLQDLQQCHLQAGTVFPGAQAVIGMYRDEDFRSI